MTEPRTLPLLPLRDIVVFPQRVSPLFVGREKSVRALEEAMKGNKEIVLATQMDAGDDDPAPTEIYQIGVLATVLQLLKLPDGTVKVLVEGKSRVAISHWVNTDTLFTVQVDGLDEEGANSKDAKALARAAADQFEGYQKLNRKIAVEVVAGLAQISEPTQIADVIAANLAVKIEQQQDLLETLHVAQRLEKILALMESEVGVLQVEKRIRNRVKRQMEKSQREYYLNEQMKAIQRELGGNDEGGDELAELEEKIASTKFSKEAREKAEAELRKLRQMSPMSAESTVVRNYLEWMVSLPWGKKKKTRKDLDKAEAVLDADHFGLEKVKERILEFLAVQNRTDKVRGPILCLVGPPGRGQNVTRSLDCRSDRAGLCARVTWGRAR
jgi:ATP-dependent Lon protease